MKSKDVALLMKIADRAIQWGDAAIRYVRVCPTV
jgi:hypothetical protein